MCHPERIVIPSTLEGRGTCHPDSLEGTRDKLRGGINIRLAHIYADSSTTLPFRSE